MKLPWPFPRAGVTPEKKSLASPDAAIEAIFGTAPTVTGIRVSAQEALAVPAVSNAIQIIAEAVASLDVMMTRKDGGGLAEAHPVIDLLTAQANEWTSGFEFVRQLVQDALMSDSGGLAWVNRPNGRPVELVRYRSTLVCTVDVETGERRYTLGNRPIAASDVIHLLPPLGRAPLTRAREAIGIAVALDRHAARLFTRGARPSGALSFPKAIGQETVNKMRAAWRATHEGEDTGGSTAILYDGATFTPFAFNSTDAQFLENRRFQIEEIARAFNIPAPMIGDLSRATWSNSEQKGREFLSYTLEPWLRALEGALNRALLSDDERAVYAIKFDRDDLTRADLATRATTINSLIASQTINPNEGREWLNLPPREGGDKFLNPNITTTATAPDAVAPKGTPDAAQ